MATLFYDQIINDSDEMRKVYLNLFKKDSKVIAYGANIRKSESPQLINKFNLNIFFLLSQLIYFKNYSNLI